MRNFPIDLVITYVDDSDPVWQQEISKFNTEIYSDRYRSWDMLKFWFRGVAAYMPFIHNIYLVVSNIEQVPLWLDTTKIHVILHKDIIPEKLLPTFNSTTIEMYLHNIKGLSEHFIYSNDDMMPMNAMEASEFFTDDGKPIYDIIHKDSATNIFWQQCKRSYMLAAKLSENKIDNSCYILTKHSMSPMLKSIFEEVHIKAKDQIFKSCTKFREPWNFTQYLFPNYALFTKKAITGNWSFQYFRLDQCQALFKAIVSDKHAIMCLNDCSIENFNECKHDLIKVLEDIFPTKCKFEKK